MRPTRGVLTISGASTEDVSRILAAQLERPVDNDPSGLIEGGAFHHIGRRGVFHVAARPRNPLLRILPIIVNGEIDTGDAGATVRYGGGLSPLAYIALMAWIFLAYTGISFATGHFSLQAHLWWAYLGIGILPVVIARQLTRSTVRSVIEIVVGWLPNTETASEERR